MQGALLPPSVTLQHSEVSGRGDMAVINCWAPHKHLKKRNVVKYEHTSVEPDTMNIKWTLQA